MDINVIEKLMKAMEDSTLTKLEIEEAGVRICMEKANPSKGVHQWIVPYNKNNGTLEEANVFDWHGDQNEEKKSESSAYDSYITSPMVGTFYLTEGLNREPYAKVGDQVKQGQTICIIESMKLMNEIEANVDGTVMEILVSDGEMVEYGQKLFKILPS